MLQQVYIFCALFQMNKEDRQTGKPPLNSSASLFIELIKYNKDVFYFLAERSPRFVSSDAVGTLTPQRVLPLKARIFLVL